MNVSFNTFSVSCFYRWLQLLCPENQESVPHSASLSQPGWFFTILFLCLCVFTPADAWALQSHGPPEGLYVHQMAHVHFFLALGYLYWDIRRSSFSGKGWGYLLIFCLLMLCWNVVAFVGHSVAIHIDPSTITATGGYLSSRMQGPYTLHSVIFYIAKFDHLLAVPALFFLYLGMRTLYQSVEKHAGEAGK